MFDCKTCTRHYNRDARKRKRCGFIPSEQWVESRSGMETPRMHMGGEIRTLDTCPGFTSQMPTVLEVASAWGWWEKGQLQLRHREPSTQLLDMIELFNMSNAAAQQYYMEQMSKGDD